MDKFKSTLILLCNYAIPSNDILNQGLGDLILKKEIPYIKKMGTKFIKENLDIFKTLSRKLTTNNSKNEFDFSDITDILIDAHTQDRYRNFYKELVLYCAQAYFSHPIVLETYKFILHKSEKIEILESEIDKIIFSSLNKS